MSMTLFAEIEKSILNFLWNLNGLQTAKAILKKKNKLGRLMLTILNFATKLQ
jgi:hypothetical protein